jgi:hypothetical protein
MNIEGFPPPFGQLSPLRSLTLPISYATHIASSSNTFAVGVEEPVWISSGTQVSSISSYLRQPPRPPVLVEIPQQDEADDLSFFGIETDDDWGL